MADGNKVLVALTSHTRLGETGKTTGYYVPEAAHAWRVFKDAGYEVDFASVAGGKAPADAADRTDPVQASFLDDEEVTAKLAVTKLPSQLDAGDYSAIFYAGGHGTMWDFPHDRALESVARAIYEAGGVVSAVCHGPAGLVNLKLSDGTYLVAGKNVGGFTNDEEDAVGLSEVVPFLLQGALEERGARHTGAANFQPHVVVDGRLVTGQNPASAMGVAEAVVKVLGS